MLPFAISKLLLLLLSRTPFLSPEGVGVGRDFAIWSAALARALLQVTPLSPIASMTLSFRVLLSLPLDLLSAVLAW